MYDNIYEKFLNYQEQQRKTNFNAFMTGLVNKTQLDLNKYYKEDEAKYNEILNNIKAQGIRVFRNSKGEHILKFMD